MRFKKVSLIICFLILVITLLPFTGAFAYEPIGKFTYIEGSVDVLRLGKLPAHHAVEGDPVFAKDIVRTKSNAKAGIAFNDGNTLKIAQRTRIDISEYISDGTTKSTLDLSRGKVEAYVEKNIADRIAASPQANKFEIRTLTAVSGVRGTEFFVYYENAVSGVFVKSGVVEVYNIKFPEVKVSVTAGQITTVAETKAPEQPRPATAAEKQGLEKDVAPSEKPKPSSEKKTDTKTTASEPATSKSEAAPAKTTGGTAASAPAAETSASSTKQTESSTPSSKTTESPAAPAATTAAKPAEATSAPAAETQTDSSAPKQLVASAPAAETTTVISTVKTTESAKPAETTSAPAAETQTPASAPKQLVESAPAAETTSVTSAAKTTEESSPKDSETVASSAKPAESPSKDIDKDTDKVAPSSKPTDTSESSKDKATDTDTKTSSSTKPSEPSSGSSKDKGTDTIALNKPTEPSSALPKGTEKPTEPTKPEIPLSLPKPDLGTLPIPKTPVSPVINPNVVHPVPTAPAKPPITTTVKPTKPKPKPKQTPSKVASELKGTFDANRLTRLAVSKGNGFSGHIPDNQRNPLRLGMSAADLRKGLLNKQSR